MEIKVSRVVLNITGTCDGTEKHVVVDVTDPLGCGSEVLNGFSKYFLEPRDDAGKIDINPDNAKNLELTIAPGAPSAPDTADANASSGAGAPVPHVPDVPPGEPGASAA